MNIITEKNLPGNIFVRIYRDNDRYVFHAVDDDSGETIERTKCPTLEQAQKRFDLHCWASGGAARQIEQEKNVRTETAVQTSLF